MKQPSLSEIDQIRNEGFRPQVVGCFTCDKKILFLHKKKHINNPWQLPQGGIDNRETVKSAFFREMSEELGGVFTKSVNQNIVLFMEEKAEFPPQTQNSRDLLNDMKQKVFMKGKKYFFIQTNINTDFVDITQSEFDNYKWSSFEEGVAICDNINQIGKKRITLNVLHKLKSMDLI